MSLPTFYIPTSDISGDTAALSGDELRHAGLTLRLRAGDTVKVVDGVGSSYTGVIRTINRDEGIIALADQEIEQLPVMELTVAMGIVRGERFDWALQKATELGATFFVPLVTDRTEGRFKGPWKRRERLERIIASACKQCGRARFPSISDPVSLAELDMGGYDMAIVFWEEEVISLVEAVKNTTSPGSCLMIIGPVGGLTAEEVEKLKERRCIAAGLGPRVLRTETAVTVGAALIQYLWGDMK